LLQILDDGRITDAQGRNVNFENTIIVMTSNAGSDEKGGSMGFGKSDTDMVKEKVIKALESFLRPEFLGRVDEVVVFSPLSNESLVKISALMLDELKPVLKEKGIELKYTKKAAEKLAELAGGGKRGARDLRRVIRKNVEDKIAVEIIGNSLISGISIDCVKDKIEIAAI